MSSKVLLVTKDNKIVGKEDKLIAHKKGLLHRAFSIFVFNNEQEMLIQRRANTKYHSAGLWSNACCSHPIKEHNIDKEVQERLNYEMGITCSLYHAFNFLYKADMGNGLIEHELDYVYIGTTNNYPRFNTSEVSAVRYRDYQSLKDEMQNNPKNFTPWFTMIVHKVWKQYLELFNYA